MENVEFAGFWRRLWAFLLDILIVGTPVQIIIYAVTGHFTFQSTSLSWANYFILVIYQVLCLTSSWQATLGKRIMSVYVVSAGDRSKLGTDRAFLRYIIFSAATLLMMIMQLTIGFSAVGTPVYSTEDQVHQKDIMYKKMRNLPLSMDDIEFQLKMNRRSAVALAHLSPEEQQRFMDITDKEVKHIPLTAEEKDFETDVLKRNSDNSRQYILKMLPFMLYPLVIVFMIGLSDQKTGPHDLVAKTRVIRGRPKVGAS